MSDEVIFDAYEYASTLFSRWGFELTEYVLDKDCLEEAYLKFLPTENVAMWILKMIQSECRYDSYQKSYYGRPKIKFFDPERLFQIYPTSEGLLLNTTCIGDTPDRTKFRMNDFLYMDRSESETDNIERPVDKLLNLVKNHLRLVEEELIPSHWITQMLKQDVFMMDSSRIMSVGPYDWYSHIEYPGLITISYTMNDILTWKPFPPDVTDRYAGAAGPLAEIINPSTSPLTILTGVKLEDDTKDFDSFIRVAWDKREGLVSIYTDIPATSADELSLHFDLKDNIAVMYNGRAVIVGYINRYGGHTDKKHDNFTLQFNDPYNTDESRAVIPSDLTNFVIIPMNHVTQIMYTRPDQMTTLAYLPET